MYKNKLSDWGLSKYMPKGLPDGITQWIAFKIDERKLDGKDTEFMYKDRVLPIDRIQQSVKRAKHHHDMIPFDSWSLLTAISLTQELTVPQKRRPKVSFTIHPPTTTLCHPRATQAPRPLLYRITLTFAGHPHSVPHNPHN